MFERTMGVWNFDNLRDPLFLDVDLIQNMKQKENKKKEWELNWVFQSIWAIKLPLV
jgi:hypothetical protein